MAFNGGNCDTDGPHNKRLCTGQSTGGGGTNNTTVSINDNNNNSSSNNGMNNNHGNGTIIDMEKGSHISARVSIKGKRGF